MEGNDGRGSRSNQIGKCNGWNVMPCHVIHVVGALLSMRRCLVLRGICEVQFKSPPIDLHQKPVSVNHHYLRVRRTALCLICPVCDASMGGLKRCLYLFLLPVRLAFFSLRGRDRLLVISSIRPSAYSLSLSHGDLTEARAVKGRRRSEKENVKQNNYPR